MRCDARGCGLCQRFFDPDSAWAAGQLPSGGRPLYIIGKPCNGAPHEAGNGQIAAFMGQDRATVLRVYHAALAAGATDECPPGQRPHYHADYFGGYCRDLDGNKLCVVCHAVE